MIDFNTEALCPSVQTLIDNKVASRVRAKDASLYNFSSEAQKCAESYMGWTTLASNPPSSIEEIQNFAYTLCNAHDEKISIGFRVIVQRKHQFK